METVINKSATPQRKAASEGNFYPERPHDTGPGMNDRIQRLRKLTVETRPSLSIERALQETAFYQQNYGKYSMPVLRALNFLDHCQKKTLYLGDDELIVAERGPAPKVVPTFPELTCHSVEDFNVLNNRDQQRYTISEEDIATYAREVIPYWQGKTIRERIFNHVPAEWLSAYEAGLFTEFMEQRAAGHTALDAKIYNKGMLDFIAVGRSVRSRSVNVIEPASLTVPPSVMFPVTSTMAMTGASLLPLMLMVTIWVSVPPLLSSTVMVKIAVTVSPTARKSRSASAMV